MRKVLLATFLGSAAALAVGSASANDELNKMSQNPKDWVMPAGDYANTRYSKLNQINAQNVGKLQVDVRLHCGKRNCDDSEEEERLLLFDASGIRGGWEHDKWQISTHVSPVSVKSLAGSLPV